MEPHLKRCLALAALLALAPGCAATRAEWQRADGSGETEAVREQRAKDLADCTTAAGAPTQGGQSTLSYSRAQIEDCMRARGWRRVSAAGR